MFIIWYYKCNTTAQSYTSRSKAVSGANDVSCTLYKHIKGDQESILPFLYTRQRNCACNIKLLQTRSVTKPKEKLSTRQYAHSLPNDPTTRPTLLREPRCNSRFHARYSFHFQWNYQAVTSEPPEDLPGYLNDWTTLLRVPLVPAFLPLPDLQLPGCPLFHFHVFSLSI